jgi:hypothetical protein
MFEQVFRSLVEGTKDVIGAKVENNKFCVSVHYRNVEEKVWLFTKQTSLVFLFGFMYFLFGGNSFLLIYSFVGTLFEFLLTELDCSSTMCP